MLNTVAFASLCLTVANNHGVIVSALRNVNYQGINVAQSLYETTCANSVIDNDAYVGARLNNVTNMCEPLMASWFDDELIEEGYAYFVKTLLDDEFDKPVLGIENHFEVPVKFDVNSTIEVTLRLPIGWYNLRIKLCDATMATDYGTYTTEQYLFTLKALNDGLNQTEINQFTNGTWQYLYFYPGGMYFRDSVYQTLKLTALQDGIEARVDDRFIYTLPHADVPEKARFLTVRCDVPLEIWRMRFNGGTV